TEVVVLEVGLGGRLDATNVVDPAVAVVTGVALDHEAILGTDILGIAREKAAIFKPGRAAVVGSSGEAVAIPFLAEQAQLRLACPVFRVGIDTPAEPPPEWPVALRGGHQRRNAACALAALDALEQATAGRLSVGSDLRRQALASVSWPGRLEKIPGTPPVWLDAGHNPDGARALAAELVKTAAPGRPLVVVVGVSADKDCGEVLGPVARLAHVLVASQAPSPRALAAGELARIASILPDPAQPRRIIVEPDPLEAVRLAQEEAGPEGTVVVYGSIYLVGAARALLLGEPLDAVALHDPAGPIG
ncbi:MAG: cyanophycin synthetase, partial [Pseudomonadota bacterium]